MSKTIKKPIVYAYGFDKLGVNTPESMDECDDFFIKYIKFDSDCSLEEADGLVIPSGIFEEFHQSEDFYDHGKCNVTYDAGLLALRERQLNFMVKKSKWVVFLLREVINGVSNEWQDSDLAKKCLNVFAYKIKHHDPEPYVKCKADEFGKYLDRFGLAQTSFQISGNSNLHREIAHVGNTPVGMEIRGQIFFLPFFSKKIDRANIAEAVALLTNSVLEYKRKNDIYLPAWVKALQFKIEPMIRNDIQIAEERLIKLKEDAAKWESYKAILCTSGHNLNTIVVRILRDFFGLNLKSKEEYVEDAIIYSDKDEVKYVVEIKGVNGGIKREHINQVDSHRERLHISSSTIGLLIINDFMDVEDFHERKAKTFNPDQLAHAEKQNVRILRTVTLFECMRAIEDRENRKDVFFERCDQAKPLVEMPLV